jgi:hypothetical protein
MKRELLFKLSAAAVIAAPFATAQADLVLFSPSGVQIGGTGLGSVSTVLTIEGQNTEAGAVCRSGSADVVGATVNSTGACQTINGGDNQALNQTRALSDAAGNGGALTAANFGIVFNAIEPAGGAITLDKLTVTFYNAAGGFLFQASTASAVNFPSTEQGNGNSGFLFVLNAAEQAAATAAGAFSSQTNRIGLFASASNADAGHETFFLANTGAVVATPEPSTAALMATGLFGLGGIVRRRRRS